MPGLLHGFRRVLLHEIRVLAADRSLWLVSGLLIGLLAYAVGNGVEQTRARDREIAETLEQQAAGQAAAVEQLRRVMAGEEAPDPWANPTDPSSVGGGLASRYALLPTAPLAPLAIGQSDMYPYSYRITTQSRVEFMYDSEIENPWNLLTGRFDPAFVLTYLLPLLVFAWSYNLLAVEREQGTLRLLLSQPVGLRTVVLGKVTARIAVLFFWAVAIPTIALLFLRPVVREGSGLVLLACWMGLIAAYALLWFALAVLVNSFAKSSALNALVLVSAWVLLVLVLPVAVNLGAALASPAPSRAGLATQTRMITMDNLERLKDRFGTEYRHVQNPEALLPRNGRFEVPERLRAFFLAGQSLDAKVETALAEFETRLADQQSIVDRFGVFSPAILVHEGMTAIAGNGTARYQRFQDQVTAFHREWKQFFEPRILAGIAVTEADFARMPGWTWKEERPRVVLSATLIRLLQMVAASGLMGLAAWVRLGRYPVA